MPKRAVPGVMKTTGKLNLGPGGVQKGIYMFACHTVFCVVCCVCVGFGYRLVVWYV